MLVALFLLPIIYIASSSSSSFQCYSCGVFLNAPTATCKGAPKTINCTSSWAPIGCVSVTAMNKDGSYYVEKRCANTEEKKLKDGECINIEMPKLIGAKKCFCTQELCNVGSTIQISLWPILSLSLLINFIFHLLNKSRT